MPFDWAVDTFRLASFLDQPVGTVSGGQLKRLMLARAMLRQPRLVLLDEPEAGVDIGGEQTLYQVLAQQVEERQVTALISSHELNMVLRVATQVICLNRRLFGIGPLPRCSPQKPCSSSMAPPQPSIPIITTTASQGDRRTGLPFPSLCLCERAV